eukprot:1158015-Pelagomonas_calceolata.AAC.8
MWGAPTHNAHVACILQVCGDLMWALSALGWYDHEVYDRIIAHMAKFESKDPRANARVFYAAALAQHMTPALDQFAAVVSTQKRLNGWVVLLGCQMRA